MPNPPSTQSVCPDCGSTDPELHPGIGVMGIADPCPNAFHDTQTQERCETCGGTGYFRAEVGPSAATGPCPDCQPAQGQVETCPDCGATGSRHYADCPRRFVVAPSDKPIRYRNEHGDFWRCANCGSTLRVGQTHTCTGPLPYGPYARLSILADALTERAEDAEAAASLAPPDPQGQVEPRDTETAYVEVLAICEACGGRVEWDQVDAHEHYKGPGHRARSMEFVEALPYLRALDQAERRAERERELRLEVTKRGERGELSGWKDRAETAEDDLQQFADSIREAMDQTEGMADPDRYHMLHVKLLSRLAAFSLNPSSTSEGDA